MIENFIECAIHLICGEEQNLMERFCLETFDYTRNSHHFVLWIKLLKLS